MASKPTVTTNTVTSDNAKAILNAIYWNASEDYRQHIPSIGDKTGNLVNVSTEILRSIGNAMLDYKAYRNEFVSALYNRIATVIITSKGYLNPWAFLKKGKLDLGETIEEVFVGLADPHSFNPEKAYETVFKRETPNVVSAFHTMNYQYYYKATTTKAELKQAFLSWDNLARFTETLISKLYDSAEMDEMVMMRYMIAKSLICGYITPIGVGEVSSENMKDIAVSLRSVASNLTFMDNRFNLAGVDTYTNFEDQYIFMDTDFESRFSVEVLADAFNMDKATYLGHRILINGFGNLYKNRLDKIFKDKPDYWYPTDAEISALNMVPAVVFDKDWFMIYDNLIEFGEIENPEGLYWNHTYHVWKTFSSSPFSNAIAFTPVTPEVTSLSLTPETLTVQAGYTAVITPVIETVGFAPTSVEWSITGDAVVDAGAVTVPQTATSGTTYTVTATSTFDSKKTATATVTVA